MSPPGGLPRIPLRHSLSLARAETQQSLIAVPHAVQQVGKVEQSLLDSELTNVMSGCFRAQSDTLLVVLLDVRLLMPRLEHVVFLACALHTIASSPSDLLVLVLVLVLLLVLDSAARTKDDDEDEDE